MERFNLGSGNSTKHLLAVLYFVNKKMLQVAVYIKCALFTTPWVMGDVHSDGGYFQFQAG